MGSGVCAGMDMKVGIDGFPNDGNCTQMADLFLNVFYHEYSYRALFHSDLPLQGYDMMLNALSSRMDGMTDAKEVFGDEG